MTKNICENCGAAYESGQKNCLFCNNELPVEPATQDTFDGDPGGQSFDLVSRQLLSNHPRMITEMRVCDEQ